MLSLVTVMVFVCALSCQVMFVCVCTHAQNVFSEANAEVMRNSLLCPCVGGGREEDGGGLVGVESH